MKKVIIIVFSLLLVVGGLGCVTLSHLLTPTEVDKQAVAYAVEAGVAELKEYTGYPNLAKALKLQRDVDVAYTLNQFEYQQLMQKDSVEHGIHKGTTTFNSTIGLQREESFFGEKGLLSLGLSITGFGMFTGVIGLLRKRPNDWTPDEVETALAEVKDEVTEKDKQVIEIVRGVQNFLNISDKSVAKSLKTLLAMSQSSSTKETIATIKALI